MGIPSYYRKLKDSIKGLVFKDKLTETHGLYFDFNCLVYHVLHKDCIKPYPNSGDEEERIVWENHLIEEVVKYVLQIVRIVKPTEEILIAVDGVVPFAKMKQQRLRRFKSAKMNYSSSTSQKWDTNAITPGTYFMERLGSRLNKIGIEQSKNSKVQWIIQDASVPGEGEQKIMAYIRKQNQEETIIHKKDIVIYGLDADLIVLSLLLKNEFPDKNIALFRENTEKGATVYDALGQETYIYLTINKLEEYILTRIPYSDRGNVILDYCMSMCFLGNDFLPHSLSQKMSEEGHEVIMNILGEMYQEGHHLIDVELSTHTWNKDAVRFIIGRLAQSEYKDIQWNLKKKLLSNPIIKKDTTPDFYPAEKVEYILFQDENYNQNYNENEFKKESRLKKGWEKIYYERWISPGYFQKIAEKSCLHYFEGLDWIIDYYLGKSIDLSWYYPYSLPPLWKDLEMYMKVSKDILSKNIVSNIIPTPQEQLTMVLPLESWWLIRNRSLKQIPYKVPQYWPLQYSYFSVGKKLMWECEAHIPLLSLKTIRLCIG